MKGHIRFTSQGKLYYLDGLQVTEEVFKARFPDKPIEEPMVASPAIWQDFTSEAMAVHPDQVGEANQRSKDHNLGVVYDQGGFAHIPDRAARKKLLKLEGLHDKKGGYGD